MRLLKGVIIALELLIAEYPVVLSKLSGILVDEFLVLDLKAISTLYYVTLCIYLLREIMKEVGRIHSSQGRFVISLDYEQYWGVRDIVSLDDYRKHMAKERLVIPMLLQLFEQYEIHATWATVGLLFSNSREGMLSHIPRDRPSYMNKNLSPYPYLMEGDIGADESIDDIHYGLSLIASIQATPYQRVSTHTFSHYYCMELGQTKEQFQSDLEAAVSIAKHQNIRIESLIFPRNQCNEQYLSLLNNLGIKSYRGNPAHSIYKNGYRTEDSMYKRAFRLLDAYLNISGSHCYFLQQARPDAPMNIPASQFLRPYSRRLRKLEFLRLERILSSMTYAAKHGLVYHLWWHPYNLANDIDENMSFLGRIVEHYHTLRARYGMQSMNMEELYEEALEFQNLCEVKRWMR